VKLKAGVRWASWMMVTDEFSKVHSMYESNSFYISLNITNKIQRYTIFFITVHALHISDGFSAHHQKLKNCTHSTRYMSSLTYTGCCV